MTLLDHGQMGQWAMCMSFVGKNSNGRGRTENAIAKGPKAWERQRNKQAQSATNLGSHGLVNGSPPKS